MLTNKDCLEILHANPKPEDTFFYYDRPILYTLTHNDNRYMVSLLDEDEDKQIDSFLLVGYSEATYALLKGKHITPKEFFTHPDNTVHHALIEYTEYEPVILLANQYEDNQTIPDEYLPTPDAKWY